MSYVGDSVLADGVSLGGGTVTGNLRLDEKDISSMVSDKPVSAQRTKLGAIIGAHCRTGIHSAIAPGIKIGEHSFINSATLVTKDIPDRSFVKNVGKDELDIRENR
jgi:bifunctional UDP-N-acetylglucosamine pyrophosphorylase/glucosamine-1-phosphate N-acetyltransferase